MYISRYISSATFAWSSKQMVDIDSMGPGLQLIVGQFSNFLLGKVLLEYKLHGMSIFHDIQMAIYFGTGWCYSHMVGYAGSPTYTVYVDVTLTRSKVKVKFTGLLNFPQLAKPCMLAAMTAAPLQGFLVTLWILFPTPNQQCQITEGMNRKTQFKMLKWRVLSLRGMRVLLTFVLHLTFMFTQAT